MFRRWIGAVLAIVVVCPGFSGLETYAAFVVGPNVAILDTSDVGKLDLKNNIACGAKFRHYFDDRGFNWSRPRS